METTIIDRGRGPEIAGTRITVYDVMDYYLAGDSLSYIAYALSIYPEQVAAAIKYIEQHKEQVAAEYQEMLKGDAVGNSPEVQEKLKVAHAKLQKALDDRRKIPLAEPLNARNSGR